jgi:NAD-dependent deacetylase
MRSEDARGLYWEAKLADWEAGRDTRPNSIHGAIVLLERAHKLEAIVTQNTDGLQRVAGTSASRLVELHGTDWCVECQRCEARGEAVPHYEAFRHTRQPPRCACGGPLKLATISSGQALREEDLEQAGRAAAGADLVVALGADLAAYPASSVPLLAAQGGAPYVIISRGLTEHDDHPLVRLRLSGDIADLFVTAVYLSCHG